MFLDFIRIQHQVPATLQDINASNIDNIVLDQLKGILDSIFGLEKRAYSSVSSSWQLINRKTIPNMSSNYFRFTTNFSC
jgi:hypothetical protein